MAVLTRLRDKWEYSEFRRCFNFQNNETRGRSLLLLNNFLVSIANVFITGVFYTGFLATNGIDIVRVGIIAFIPYVAWAFSLFSPIILKHFKKRRWLLITNNAVYYTCIVLATTIMPMFVTDTDQKTIWFAVFIFLGNLVNALLGSGASAWHLHFIPNGQERDVYFCWMNLVSYIMSTVTAIGSALAADALAGSPAQATIIVVLRFVAYGVFIINFLCLYLIPREYPYEATEQKVRLTDIFTVPFKTKKFMLTVVILVWWNAACNVNASTWSYYMLDTVGVNYLVMYISSIVCAVSAIFLQRKWRDAIQRFNWFRVILFCVLCTGLWELIIGFTTAQTVWVYILVCVLSGLSAVGTNLVFANLFYLNLPKKSNTDIFATFWNFVANIAVFIGSLLGTWFISVTEDAVAANGGPWMLFGLPFYGSQFLVWIKFALLFGLGYYIWRVTPKIKPDEE